MYSLLSVGWTVGGPGLELTEYFFLWTGLLWKPCIYRNRCDGLFFGSGFVPVFQTSRDSLMAKS